MARSYYSASLEQFLKDENEFILGKLTENHKFSLEEQQKEAWRSEIIILKDQLEKLGEGHVILEYTIPRMGKRVDTIFIYQGIVFVIEFKVNEKNYHTADIDQCLDYALDLKNFHMQSHTAQLVPVLVATDAAKKDYKIKKDPDGVFYPITINAKNIRELIEDTHKKYPDKEIDPTEWINSIYKPTPTIIEAAQYLYQNHDVKEISRSDAGAENLVKTSEEIKKIIETSKKNKKKSICFITGVPGSGKTLAGLNIANQRHNFEEDEHAVFLSGNGPLVMILQEALARSELKNATKKMFKKDARQKAKSFIQNIHHFRDDALDNNGRPPIEKIVIFDEAQRAWNKKQTATFMKIKKNKPNFSMSEPEFLISVLDRHKDWAVIICLVGGGQEINTGEAGLTEWFSALRRSYPDWDVYISKNITDTEYTHGEEDMQGILEGMNVNYRNDLHLQTSIRSFRSEHVSNLVKAILDKNKSAQEIYQNLEEKYPIVITRDATKAKQWVINKSRGTERYGLIASSKAYRLKPFGMYVDYEVNHIRWFLNSKTDVKSSYYLEYVATEFDIQGLELDWTCVAWDGDLRFCAEDWSYNQFRGNKWQKIRQEERMKYLKNAYRVLLTRARQGMVIFVPEGKDEDPTRNSTFYDNTFEYLKNIGLKEI